jgi:hypothetical protein
MLKRLIFIGYQRAFLRPLCNGGRRKKDNFHVPVPLENILWTLKWGILKRWKIDLDV